MAFIDFQSGKNPYDMSQDCEGELPDTLCYPVTKSVSIYSNHPGQSISINFRGDRHISAYLSRPDIRTMLGVDPSVTGNFTSCSSKVSSAFIATLDEYHSSHYHVAALLERGVKALIYVGTYDWICNWVGNERWTLALEWSGQTDYVAQTMEGWKVDGKRVGQVRSAKGLTFATVEGAGHMVSLQICVMLMVDGRKS
jgi:carboxypeptidase C (cathepsin A)